MLIGCGRPDKPLQSPSALQQQYDARSATMSTDWTSTDCDSALWAGLAVRGGNQVAVESFLAADGADSGRPMRLPGRDCVESSSTTSNDMVGGIILGLHAAGNLDALNRLWDYGEQHNWYMGTGPVTRVYLRPNGRSLLALAIYHLGGADHIQRFSPIIYGPVSADYEKHLQYTSLLTQNDTGASPNLGELVVCKNYDRADALASAVCGDKQHAADLLLSDYQCPTYVRGATPADDELYCNIHKLLAAKVALE